MQVSSSPPQFVVNRTAQEKVRLVNDNYNKDKYEIEEKIYEAVSLKLTPTEKIKKIHGIIRSIGNLEEHKVKILIHVNELLYENSFITESNHYEISNRIYGSKSRSWFCCSRKSSPIVPDEGLLEQQESQQKADLTNQLIEELCGFVSKNLTPSESIKSKLTPIGIVRGVGAFLGCFVAAFNGFTGGARSLSIFSSSIFKSESEFPPDVPSYTVGFASQVMIAWTFNSVSVKVPVFTWTHPKTWNQEMLLENITSTLSCLFAASQAIPSALYTYENVEKSLPVYFNFLGEDNNIVPIIISILNFICNTVFGLGQAQGIKNLSNNIIVRFENAHTKTEKAELIADITGAMLATVPIVYIFIEPVCDLTDPKPEWAWQLPLALYLNIGETKFYFGANMVWGVTRYLKIVAKWGFQRAFKTFAEQNINRSNIVPLLLSTMGSLCNLGNTRETLVSDLDMAKTENRNLLIAWLICEFLPGYIGNRATFD